MGEFNFLFVAIADLISNKSLKTSNWVKGHLDKCPPSFKIKFSDRPENRAGSDQVWERAEQALKSATKMAGYDFLINRGEGCLLYTSPSPRDS